MEADMSPIQAEMISICWQPEKRRWTVAIAIGQEVIKRSPVQSLTRDAADDVLRACAVETALDEGYAVLPHEVNIVRV